MTVRTDTKLNVKSWYEYRIKECEAMKDMLTLMGCDPAAIEAVTCALGQAIDTAKQPNSNPNSLPND